MVKLKTVYYLNFLSFICGILFVLSYGASNLGIRIGDIIIPLSQIALAFSIIFLFFVIIKNNLKFNSLPIQPFIFVYVMYILLEVLVGIMNYGIMAVRDATNFIDLFLAFFVLSILLTSALEFDLVKYITKLLWIVLNINFIYAMTILSPHLQIVLNDLSPVVNGLQSDIKVIGHYTMTHFVVLLHLYFNLYFMTYSRSEYKGLIHIQNILILLLILFTTSRITILSIFILFIVVLFLDRKVIKYLSVYLIIATLSILLIDYLNIVIRFRRGGAIGIHFITNMLLSFLGLGENSDMASGSSMRFVWWKQLLGEVNSTKDVLIGKGFGISLTDFVSESGVLVREPHNSILSIFCRTGLVGLFFWLFINIYFFIFFIRNYLKQHHIVLFFPICLMAAAFLNSLAEPYFEQSYNTMPYYYIVALCYAGIKVKSIRELE